MTEDELNEIVNRVIQKMITEGVELNFAITEEDHLEFLEQELAECIINEEYEKAALIQEMIDKLKNEEE